MAVISDNDILQFYNYEVKDFYFTNKGEKTKISGYKLNSLVIINDYIENIFPIIQIKVTMDSITYYDIISNKDTIKVRLRIQKYTRKPANKQKSIKSLYIDTSFKLILNDNDEDLYADVRKTNHNGKIEEEDLYEQANEVEFFLFRSDLIKASKKKINRIFESATVTDGIAYIASKVGIDDLLMSKSNNEKEYSPFIIPPLKATDAFQYIDTFYGIYNISSMLYFGIEASYLLRFEGKCTAYRDKEKKIVKIIIPKAGTKASQNLCSVNKYNENDCYYIIGNYENIEFEDQTVTKNLTSGDSIHVIHADAKHAEVSAASLSNKKIVINRGYNQWFEKIYKNKQNSLKKIITVQFADIDLDALTPNKKFSFIFEDTKLDRKYRGTYILVKSEIALMKTEKDLRASAKCVFRQG